MGVASLWMISRARRAAISTIAPMVDLSRGRIGSIPPTRWQEPYMIGFLTMLISIVAKLETRGRLDGDDLGLAQAQAWQAITGLSDDRIGEDICLLSANADPDFWRGCSNAARFFDALYGRQDPVDPDIRELCEDAVLAPAPALTPNEARAFGRAGAIAAALWARYFDDRIC
ncbi:hypothetical protein [Hyphomicrobium sp.]|nr:hypothetical protein [Hyphomicrobium sp.]